jgi:hypothetical protein
MASHGARLRDAKAYRFGLAATSLDDDSMPATKQLTDKPVRGFFGARAFLHLIT